ncbi:rhodanese-like domain-containing protein [Fodinibius sediminis]|nr:rhodanese-like domain-containing protein [Fodinibius sediminis]
MVRRRFLAGVFAVMGLVIVLGACSSDSPVKRISAEEFQQKIEEEPGVIIDVRTKDEYNAGHLAMVDEHHDLLNGDFEAHLKSLDKEKTYYLYCRSGNRSGKAADLMAQNGFKKVYNIGGFEDLVQAGLESEE